MRTQNTKESMLLLPVGNLVPVRAKRVGETIEFSRGSKRIEAPSSLLAEFLELRAGDPRKITAFALRYGALGLCKHGLPASHDHPVVQTTRPVAEVQMRDFKCEPLGIEPFDAWADFSQFLSDTLDSARALQSHGSVPHILRDRLFEKGDAAGVKGDVLLAIALDHILALAGIRPGVLQENTDGVALVVDDRSPLLGALALQLLRAVNQSEFATCSVCSRVYLPKRKPKRGQANYCEMCRQDASSRLFRRREAERKEKE